MDTVVPDSDTEKTQSAQQLMIEFNGRAAAVNQPILIPTDAGDITFLALQAADLHGEWGFRVAPHLKQFEETTGSATMGELSYELLRGHAQLWAACDAEHVRAIAVTQVHQAGADRRYLHIWVAQGKFASQTQALAVFRRGFEVIEEWARSIDCCAIEIVGREGWKRLLPGLRKTATVYRKSLIGIH